MTDETNGECAHDWRCYFSGHGQPLVKHRCAKCGMFKVIDQAFLGGPHVAVIYQGMDEPYDDKQRRGRGESMGWFREEPAKPADETNDGGPAFPGETRTRVIKADGDFMTVSSEVLVAYHPGMSLRDWFAGQALAPLIERAISVGLRPGEVGRDAYVYADAMLKAREARP